MEPDYKRFGELKSLLILDLAEVVKTRIPVDGNASKLMTKGSYLCEDKLMTLVLILPGSQ